MNSGIVVINKPSGFTSHDVCVKLRKIYGTRKIGHTGTLDPMATGVLCVCIGTATKLISFLPDTDKKYIAEFVIGYETDTLDSTGNIINTTDNKIAKEQLEAAIVSFHGKQLQLPPMYSAKKINGKKLYEYAREGKEVERESCEIEIFSINLLSYSNYIAKIEVHCSSGTYIRSLIKDIANSCNSMATMTSLFRTVANGYGIEQSHTISEIENNCPSEYIISFDELKSMFQQININSSDYKKAINGTQIITTLPPSDNIYSIVYENVFIGLGTIVEHENNNYIKFKKVFSR